MKTASAEPTLGIVHFGAASLGDERRTNRLVMTADLLAARPSGPLPQRLTHPADLEGLYTLVRAEAVTHAAVLEPHRQQTLAAGRDHDGVVLWISDTTELDYTGRKSLKKLGPIGNGGGRGYLCHNTLGVRAADRQIIGLGSQILHKRARAPQREKLAAKRQRKDRESRLWLRGCEAVGPAPDGKRWVDVCDRGADTFEFIEFEHARGRHYVIRVSRDRKLAADAEDAGEAEAIEQTLKGHARHLPDLGQREVTVSANTNQPARTAAVRIAAGAVTIRPPRQKRGEHGEAPIATWVVHVREVNPPEGAEPLEWILLSNVPAESLAEARQRVDWYACRPIVEEFHKGKKSGACIEDLQFTDEQRLEPVIALLSVVTALLLKLREAARDESAATTPAVRVVSPLHVKVLSLWRHGEVRMNMTVREFYYAVARPGGHQNRTGDGFPGWITLWGGWQALQPMIEVAALMERCGET